MTTNGGSGGVKVEFGCPACGRAVEMPAGTKGPCRHCGAEASLPPAPPRLDSCLACGCKELYRQRDFNQKLGLLLVALGAILWLFLGSFWPMAAAAAVDLLLYALLKDVAICYRCKAHHRGAEGIAALPRFDLERHEHYRFEKARRS
ncbi:MAG: hypothetical protein L6Q95_00025 [Planctomycetes bacterium]|nr:hypothetical protein [Planctomycetota bacterium]